MIYLGARAAGVAESQLPESSLEAVAHAVSLGVNHVEITVHRTLDGKFVLSSTNTVLSDGSALDISSHTLRELDDADVYLETYTDALSAMWGKIASAHIVLGFTSPDHLSQAESWEVLAARMAVDILGADSILFTSRSDSSVLRLRTWSRERWPDLKIGLQLENDEPIGLAGRILRQRLTGCKANLVACDTDRARRSVRKIARRLDLALMVQSVDDHKDQDYWSKKSRCWAISSNYPGAALERRSTALSMGLCA